MGREGASRPGSLESWGGVGGAKLGPGCLVLPAWESRLWSGDGWRPQGYGKLG